jgi:hypothetical protein
MKLYTFGLVSIILLSLLFGRGDTIEGVRARARARARAKAKPKKPTLEYGGVFLIQNQLILLKQIKDRLKLVPQYEIKPDPRKEINDSLDTITNNLRTWLNNRIKYLELNKRTPIAPSESESIDGLKKMWLDNGMGLKVLVDGIIERLNIGESKQQKEVHKLIKIFEKNMNMELDIVLSDIPTNAGGNFGDFGDFGDSVMNSFDDIFKNGMFKLDCAEGKNLTYEERYS